MDNTVCGRCSVSKITQSRTCIFSKNIYIFRNLKLEIALAIPASNDEKYNLNNSAGQGLKLNHVVILHDLDNKRKDSNKITPYPVANVSFFIT